SWWLGLHAPKVGVIRAAGTAAKGGGGLRYMLRQEGRVHALNYFLKEPARVAPMAPLAVSLRGSLRAVGSIILRCPRNGGIRDAHASRGPSEGRDPARYSRLTYVAIVASVSMVASNTALGATQWLRCSAENAAFQILLFDESAGTFNRYQD